MAPLASFPYRVFKVHPCGTYVNMTLQPRSDWYSVCVYRFSFCSPVDVLFLFFWLLRVMVLQTSVLLVRLRGCFSLCTFRSRTVVALWLALPENFQTRQSSCTLSRGSVSWDFFTSCQHTLLFQLEDMKQHLAVVYSCISLMMTLATGRLIVYFISSSGEMPSQTLAPLGFGYLIEF